MYLLSPTFESISDLVGMLKIRIREQWVLVSLMITLNRYLLTLDARHKFFLMFNGDIRDVLIEKEKK